jgi:plasmid maintenance system killer protein
VAHAVRLGRQLAALDTAKTPADMNLPGWALHPLKGRLANQWSISVNENWRLTFTFENGDAAQLGVDRTTLSKVLNGRADKNLCLRSGRRHEERLERMPECNYRIFDVCK